MISENEYYDAVHRMAKAELENAKLWEFVSTFDRLMYLTFDQARTSLGEREYLEEGARLIYELSDLRYALDGRTPPKKKRSATVEPKLTDEHYDAMTANLLNFMKKRSEDRS